MLSEIAVWRANDGFDGVKTEIGKSFVVLWLQVKLFPVLKPFVQISE